LIRDAGYFLSDVGDNDAHLLRSKRRGKGLDKIKNKGKTIYGRLLRLYGRNGRVLTRLKKTFLLLGQVHDLYAAIRF